MFIKPKPITCRLCVENIIYHFVTRIKIFIILILCTVLLLEICNNNDMISTETNNKKF